MAITVHLDIVSADKNIFSGLVEMVILTGEMGELGILPGHAPLLTAIQPGPIRVIKQGNKEEVFFVSSGILEVQPTIVTVLADTVVRALDLDEAKAAQARENAKKLLEEKRAKTDFSQALADLAFALAQLRTIRSLRGRK